MQEWALELTTDVDHRFDLAIQLKKLDLAREIASKSDSEEKWRQLSDLAMQALDFVLVEECMWKSDDFASLLLLYSSNGNATKMHELATAARNKGKFNIAFSALLSLNQIDACLDLLINTERLAEAAFMARSYAPSRLSEIVGLWKAQLGKQHPRQANCLADPQQYRNLFPELSGTLEDESVWRQNPNYSDIPASNFIHLLNGDNEAAMSGAKVSRQSQQPQQQSQQVRPTTPQQVHQVQQQQTMQRSPSQSSTGSSSAALGPQSPAQSQARPSSGTPVSTPSKQSLSGEAVRNSSDSLSSASSTPARAPVAVASPAAPRAASPARVASPARAASPGAAAMGSPAIAPRAASPAPTVASEPFSVEHSTPANHQDLDLLDDFAQQQQPEPQFFDEDHHDGTQEDLFGAPPTGHIAEPAYFEQAQPNGLDLGEEDFPSEADFDTPLNAAPASTAIIPTTQDSDLFGDDEDEDLSLV